MGFGIPLSGAVPVAAQATALRTRVC